MNRILYIINDGPTLKVGFTFAADAARFIEDQSSNPSWRSQWVIRFLDNGNVSAETTNHVVLHLNT